MAREGLPYGTGKGKSLRRDGEGSRATWMDIMQSAAAWAVRVSAQTLHALQTAVTWTRQCAFSFSTPMAGDSLLG